MILPGSAIAETLEVGIGQQYATIQSAINASADGDTIYVQAGVYPETVIVDKQLTLLGIPTRWDNRPLIAGWPNQTVPGMLITADNVAVDSFDFRGINSPDTPWQNRSEIDTGIQVEGKSCQLRNLSVSGFASGIEMLHSAYDGTKSRDNESKITGSNISYNVYGVMLYEASNVSICENDFVENTVHIHIAQSDHISVYQNNFIQAYFRPMDFLKNGGGVVRNSSSPVLYEYKGRKYVNYTGNYWSNYTGADQDGDGVGDTPYVIQKIESHWYPGTFDYYTDNYPAIAPVSSYRILNKRGQNLTAATPKPDLYAGYPPASLHVLHVGPGQIYSTIQRAVDTSTDGDTIYVHGGVYPEAVVVDKQLTLTGVPNSSGGRPIIAGWASNTTPGMLITKGGVIVDGFDFSGEGNHSIGMHVKNPAGMYSSRGPGLDCTIRNVSVGGFQWGLEMEGCNNVTVTGSEFRGNGVGIGLSFVSNCSVSRCNFDSQYQAAGIDASWNVTFSQNNFIGYSGCGLGFTHYASEIRGNSARPGTYAFRSATFGNYTGNYWANYAGTDTNDDGIGDSPYVMGVVPPALVNMSAVNVTDDYPAIGEWSFENGTITIREPKNQSVPTAQSQTPSPNPAQSGYGMLLTLISLISAATSCTLLAARKRP